MRVLWLSVLLIFAFSSASAQSIIVGSITELQSCVGDDITVPYTATGPFATDNQFFVQLSDASGSFKNWTNSTQRSARMSDVLPMHLANTGNHYRVRIASTDPYVTSADNGMDLSVSAYPDPQPGIQSSHTIYKGFVGETIHFVDQEPAGSRVSWHFGPDAVPDTSSSPTPAIVFNKPGNKSATVSVVNAAGCSKLQTISFGILDCSPSIPSDARIVTNDASGDDPVVWVKTGGNYSADALRSKQTIFLEPGGQATVGGILTEFLVYMKSGASLINNHDYRSNFTAVLAPDITLTDCDTFHCSTLSFGVAAVEEEEAPSVHASLSNTELDVTTAGEPCMVTLLDVVGKNLLRGHVLGTANYRLDTLPPGVYLLVLDSGSKRVVRKIIL
jgi:hypothetical protein